MKLLQSVAIAALVAGLAAPSVLALDFGGGATVTGTFELEYNDFNSSTSQTLGYGEVDISFGNPDGGFGGFVGFDAFVLEDESATAFYGALTFAGGFGKFQIGVPRTALDDYIGTPEVGGSKLVDLELSIATGSVLPVLYLGEDFDPPVGLRYDGNFGAAKVGFSYHQVDDTDLLAVGMNYELGQIVVRAGLEHARDSGSSATSYFLGAEGEFGALKTGVLLADSELLVDARTAKLYAVYTPIDGLDLTGTYIAIDQSSTSDLFGLGARYTFGQGLFVEAGALDGKLTEAYNVSVGVNF